jgi:PAS domain S-box-containing protein
MEQMALSTTETSGPTHIDLGKTSKPHWKSLGDPSARARAAAAAAVSTVDHRSPSSAAHEAERLSLFIHGVTDYAIYMLSPQGHVVSWNAGAERFKGYVAEEIVGQHFSRFYTQEDRDSDLPTRALQVSAQAGKFEAEGWRVRKDGSQFWCSVVIDPIRDEAGELIGFAKITRDITDRREAQEMLRLSEERFTLLVQGVTDYAIYMLSPAGVVTNWNEGARRIKGYADHEVIGSNFSRFYTAEDQAAGAPMTALATAREQGRFEAEDWRVRKGGTRFWAHVVIDPIRDSRGKVVGFAKITRDITERKQAESQLETTREALVHSQKLDAIGKLTGGLAHDFNNLLNVMGNGISLLRRRIEDPAALRTLDTMERVTKRGAMVTGQLLNFARKQPMKAEQRDLNRVIASFEEVLRRTSCSGIEFALNLGPGISSVIIDPEQFEAAILNLTVNARDAVRNSGKITVSTHDRLLKANEVGKLLAGRYGCVSVSDTGAGMTPEVMARAVEPFFTTKELGKGTGLGLSQVLDMVQQSGGDLAISSEIGVGSTVSLYFPAFSEEAGHDVSLASTQKVKVLVVDDDPDALQMTVDLFMTLGFDVLSATNGEDALHVLRATPGVKTLFSDVAMPGMSGIDLGHQARAVTPHVSVILVSGYAADAAGDGTLDGFQFLAKPYRVADVMKKLEIVGQPLPTLP